MSNRFICEVLLLCTLIASQLPAQGSSTSLLQDAAAAMTAGKLTRAETDIETVLRTAPNDYRALDLLGVLRVLQKHESQAEPLFLKAVKQKPNFAPARAHLGLLFIQEGRTGEALPQLREALRIDPGRRDAADALVPALQAQARTTIEAGNTQQGLALLSEAARFEPDDPDVQFALGTTELQTSLLDDAIAAFQRVLKIRENDALALYNLGRAYLAEWRFEEARQQFARYIALRPDDAAGHCALGMTLAALERLPEARDQFERSIVLDSKQTESYFRLGLIELNLKDLDNAAQNFRQVLMYDPKHTGALSGLGRIAYEQKHYPDALNLLQRALANDNSLREAHYYLGLTFARIGRKEEAEDQLQTATRLDHDEAQRRRTAVQIRNGDSNAQSQQ
ncbi:MAG TPA: tetratricopeptide repeat protein [Terriglobales bacterium]|nr:tetratricopeptide repeat protein [Terriglobales bacterium]